MSCNLSSSTIEIPEGMRSSFVNSVISQYLALQNLKDVNVTYNRSNFCFWGEENLVKPAVEGIREFIQSHFELLSKWQQEQKLQQQEIKHQILSKGRVQRELSEYVYSIEFSITYLAQADPFRDEELGSKSFFSERLLPAFINDVRLGIVGSEISFSELEDDQFHIELVAETESECEDLNLKWNEALAVYRQLLIRLGYATPISSKTGSGASNVK